MRRGEDMSGRGPSRCGERLGTGGAGRGGSGMNLDPRVIAEALEVALAAVRTEIGEDSQAAA
jgi:hypothetical protein